MKNPLLVTMNAPPGNSTPTLGDYLELDDFQAGVVALRMLANEYPGLKWNQLPAIGAEARMRNPASMGGWLTDLKKGASKIGSAVVAPVTYAKDAVGDVFSSVGSNVADAARLFTSDDVVGGVNNAFKGFSDGGGVAGFWGGSDLFGGGGGSDSSGGGDSGGGFFMNLISGIGSMFKTKVAAGANEAGMFGGGSVLPWAIAGSAVLLVFFARPGAAPARRR